MATDRENRVAGTDQYERDSSVPASLILPLLPSHSLSLSPLRSFSLAHATLLSPSCSLFSPFSLFPGTRTGDPSFSHSLFLIPKETPPALAYAPFHPRKRTHACITRARKNVVARAAIGTRGQQTWKGGKASGGSRQ